MNIQDYIPPNFHPDKFHPLKCLWLFNRKSELLVEYLRQVPLGDVEAFRKINPVISSSEQLQRETGLTLDDIYEFSNIGGYIHEFLEMLNMSPAELQDHIDTYESDPPQLDPEDQASIEEMWREIAQNIEEKDQMRQQFGEIINDNFNDKEKPTNG